jgi:hypothetical protein
MACLVAPLVAASAVCRAAPVVFPASAGGTGHAYEVVFDTAASYDAATTVAESLGGHLVSINSAAEQAFVEGLLVDAGANTGSYWIGLERSGAGAAFGWASGETLTFSNFASGEPNDYGSTEDFGQIYWAESEADDMHDRSGKWNDAGRDGYPNGDFAGEPTPDLGRAGYVVELLDVGGGGNNPPPTAIPLPPALLAAPVGLLIAGLAARRRRVN